MGCWVVEFSRVRGLENQQSPIRGQKTRALLIASIEHCLYLSVRSLRQAVRPQLCPSLTALWGRGVGCWSHRAAPLAPPIPPYVPAPAVQWPPPYLLLPRGTPCCPTSQPGDQPDTSNRARSQSRGGSIELLGALPGSASSQWEKKAYKAASHCCLICPNPDWSGTDYRRWMISAGGFKWNQVMGSVWFHVGLQHSE